MKEFMIRNYYSGQMTKGIFKGLILSLFTMVTALAYGQIPPTAIQDEIFTYDSESASGDLSENDLNPSNSTLTYTILEGTSLGDLTVNSDGTWLFIPDIYISGANDTLIYQVCDQLNQCSQDTIRLYIQFHNNVPEPANDYIYVEMDTPRFGNAAANDFEPDYLTDPVSGFDDYANTTVPAHGDLIMLLDGTFQYTPDPGFTGTDSFYYVMCDPCGSCAGAIVYITVVASNEEPVASNSPLLAAFEDTEYNGDISGLATDPEGDDLEFSVLTSPAHGVVLMNSDGTFTYSPDADFHGNDSFMYLVCDIVGQCVVAFVYLDVQNTNDAPVAVNDSSNVNEDSVNNSGNAALNDEDESPASLVYDIYIAPLHGTASITSNGVFSYTPVGNFSGPDYFVVEVCDGFLLCDTSSVFVNVLPQNDPPVAVIDDYFGYEDYPVTGTLDNDTDIDLDDLTYTAIGSVTGGTFEVESNGDFTFTPNENYWGFQTITYQVCDPSMACVNGTLYLEIIEINDDPIINPDVVTGNEDAVIGGNLRTNDIEPDGEEIFYFTVSAPEHGVLDLEDDGNFVYTPDENWFGQEVISFYGCDPCSVCFLTTLTINVIPVNDVPTIDPVSFSTNEDITYSANISSSASDIEVGALTFSIETPALHGSISITSGGVLTYVPVSNYNGSDSAEITVCDAQGSCATNEVTITVNPVNDPPVASDSEDATIEDNILNGTITSASDIDDVVLTYTMISPPMHGEMTLNPDGSYTYDPDQDYDGIDFVTFEVCDDDLSCDAAVFTIVLLQVNDIPVANDDVNVTYENDNLSGTVADNDLDADDEELSFEIIADASHGTFVLQSNGDYTYVPDMNYNGNDQITYLACDPSAACDMAVLYITIFPVNTAPEADNADFTTNEDILLTGSLAGYISDVEGGVMIFTNVTSPAHGILSLSVNGSFTYQPTSNYSGTDQFTYQVCDTGDACDQAVVNINVNPQNDAPIVANEEDSLLEDEVYNGDLSSNDSDVENDVLTYSIVLEPTDGYAIIGVDGTITYTPTDNFVGDVLIGYEVCDDDICSNGEILLHILPVNDGPVAQDDAYSALEDMTLSANVAQNDEDIDDVTLLYTLLSGTAHGTLNFDSDGSFTYLPNADFNGVDSFTYEACDSGDLCSTAVVNISVDSTNDLPIAGDDVFNIEEDELLIGVLNDNDVDPENAALTYTIAQGPVHGTLTLDLDGGFEYSPEENFFGQDNAIINVCDALNGCVTTDLHILISPLNDVPIAVGESISTDEDEPISGSVAGNDTDIESLLLEYQIITAPEHGELILGQNGDYTYSPDLDFHGNDVVVYQVCDDDNGCSSATLNITVLPTSDNPVATGEYVHVLEDTFNEGDLSLNDVDADGDELTYVMLTPPFHGEFLLNEDGTYLYTPVPDYSGMDSIYYNVCDPTNMCDMAVIVFEVDFGNDSPIAFDDSFELEQDSFFEGNVATNDVEPDGENLYFTLYEDNTNGIFSLGEDGTFTYLPNDGATGTFTATYYACDPCGVCDEGLITFVVVPIGEGNTAPVAFNVTESVCLGGTVSIDLDNYVGDIQDVDANLHFTIDQPSHGTMTFDEETHIVEYSADTDNTDDVSFGYSVCDNAIVPMCSSALLNVSLMPIITPTVSSVEFMNVTCQGMANGSINITMQSQQSGLSFDWSNDSTSEDIFGLIPGDYTVVISNDEECGGTTTLDFTIAEPEVLDVTIGSSSNINDDGNGAIDIVITGGNAPYNVTWSGPNSFESQEEDLTNLDMIGVYHAEIVDSLGCTANVELEITGMSELSLSSFSVSPNPFHNEFLVTPKAGGSMVLSYQIMDAAGRLIIDVNNMTSGIITVDASKLAVGCYQLRLNTNNGVQMIGLIKE